MIPVQDLAGLFQVDVLLADGIPWQIQTGFQIADNHARLMGTIRQLSQPVTLLEELFFLQFRQLQFSDAVAELVRFLLRVVVFTQLVGDCFHLFAQKIFPLVLVDLLLGLLADLALDLKHLYFTL